MDSKKEEHSKDAAKTGEAAAPQKDMEELGKTLSTLSDQMLRLQAEFDNYKKRTAKEKEALIHQSEAKLMLRMLPVYEEIKLAEAEAAKIHDEAIRKGILLVLGKLRSSFEKEGLSEMKLSGEKFDPFRHEAAMHEPSGLPEGAIVRIIKKGYAFRGEILQHAIVSVSSGAAGSVEIQRASPSVPPAKLEDIPTAASGKKKEEEKKTQLPSATDALPYGKTEQK